ncbi:MAG: hypothetical protein RL708_1776 [Bacteroidota bacterium]|jgi:hypothetical protein
MKNTISFILSISLIILIFSNKAFAHKEWVHQYMVREAYKMLKSTRGVNYGVYNDMQFGLNFWSGGGDYFGEGNPNDPWNTNSPIIVGAWREDEEDIVFGYKLSPGHCGDATMSHFWQADNGDNYMTHLVASSCIAYNSWQKARIMLFNGNNFELTLKKSGSFDYPIHLTSLATTLYTVNVSEFKIKYNSIFDLYNGNYKVEPIISNTDQIILNLFSNYSNGFDNASNWVEWKNEGKSVALQILGRVAHLLGDQSVPTHAHGRMHPCDVGDGDYYELDMGSSLTYPVCNTMPYNNGTCSCTADSWDYNTAIQQGGLLDGILCLNDQDALHYLFYSTNQLADFFPSGSNAPLTHAYTAMYPFYAGNTAHDANDLTNNLLSNFYTIFNNNSPGAVNTQQIGGITFNYAIRSVATLLYWFQTRLQDYQPTAYVQNANTLNNSSITTLAANVPGSIYVTNTNTKVYAYWGIEAGNNVTAAYSTGDFVVANGTASKFLAGSSIHLQPGFKVEAGADFQAKIITFPCTGPSARQPNQEQFNDSDLIRLVHIGSDSIVHQNYTPLLADTNLSIFPNPFTQTTTLQFTNTANEEFTLDLFDITGRVVFTMQKITGTQYTFNRNTLADGVYLLKLKSNTKSYTERLVVQD